MGPNVGPTGPTVIVVNGGNQNPVPPPPLRCPQSQDSLSSGLMARHAHKKKKKHWLQGFAAAIGLTALAVVFRKHIPESFRFWEAAKPAGCSPPLRPLTVEQEAAHHVISSEMRAGKSWDDIKSNDHFKNTSSEHLFQNALESFSKKEGGALEFSPHPRLLEHMCSDKNHFTDEQVQAGIERMLFSGHNYEEFKPCVRLERFDPYRADYENGWPLSQRLSDKGLKDEARLLQQNPNWKFGKSEYFIQRPQS